MSTRRIDERGLAPATRLVLAYVRSFEGVALAEAFTSIAEHVGISERHVSRSIAALEAHKFVSVDRSRRPPVVRHTEYSGK